MVIQVIKNDLVSPKMPTDDIPVAWYRPTQAFFANAFVMPLMASDGIVVARIVFEMANKGDVGWAQMAQDKEAVSSGVIV